MNVFQFLQMIRVKHWIKEVFVVAPLLFSCRFTSPDSIIKALLASAAFALASSFVYVINDLIDIECDRYHPKKKYRPIASGAIRKARHRNSRSRVAYNSQQRTQGRCLALDRQISVLKNKRDTQPLTQYFRTRKVVVFCEVSKRISA